MISCIFYWYISSESKQIHLWQNSRRCGFILIYDFNSWTFDRILILSVSFASLYGFTLYLCLGFLIANERKLAELAYFMYCCAPAVSFLIKLLLVVPPSQDMTLVNRIPGQCKNLLQLNSNIALRKLLQQFWIKNKLEEHIFF